MSFIVSAAHVELLRIRHEAKARSVDRNEASRASRAWTALTVSQNNGNETVGAVNAFTAALAAGALNLALAAYWQDNAAVLKLTPAKHRLFVNPPAGLEPAAETAFTYGRDNALNGAYGHRYASIDDPLVIRNEGTHWDDIAIFWTGGIQIEQVYNRILPGTVIAVYEPGRLHDFWLQFLGFERFVPDDSRYRFNPVYEAQGDQLRTSIYGTEAAHKSEA